jgi:GAF domain-containing protein
MPSIWVKNGPLKGKSFELLEEAISIGRDPSETIQVLDQGVSRQHAEIRRVGEMCFIRDLGSTNGTFVNEQRVAEELLRAGDQIRIGSTVLLFEDAGPPQTAPPREVEYAGAESDVLGLNTVEIAVDRESSERVRPIGREVDSPGLQMLYGLARLAGAATDLQAFYAQSLERIAAAVRADGGSLFELDRASGKLASRARVAAGPEVERKVSRAIVRLVMQSGRSVLTSDATADDRFALRESVILRRIRSVVAAPILAEGRTEGLLYLYADRVDAPFRQEDLELATAAAIQLGLAAVAFSSAQRERRAAHGLAQALVAAAERRDPARQGHSARVAQYAVAIAVQMGLPRPDVQRLQLAALLHDAGRLALPPEPPPGADAEAWRAERAKADEQILGAVPDLADLLPVLRAPHARPGADSAAPGGNGLPAAAHILAVADAFDRLCTRGGAGGAGMPVKDALVELTRNDPPRHDPAVVEALLIAHRNGSLYQANDLFGR